MDYLVYQLEVGDSGTPHIQGYVRFKASKFLEAAKRCIHDTAHLEPARGSEEQNRSYCTKDGGSETTEHGEYLPHQGQQGHRSDLHQVTTAIKNGTPMREIATNFPETYVRYHNGLTQLQRALAAPPAAERPVRCVILWGPTATGKTHRVRTSFPGIFSIRAGRGPFDNYEGQAEVLFDEFRFEEWPISDMNQYCDKWPCTLNCRYYNRQAAWNHVFICANSDPDGWWPNDGYLLRQAFFRRITAIHEINSKEEFIVL